MNDVDTGGQQTQDNRATVAQTLAEVRGLRDFVDAKLTDVQRQLDRVGELPTTVAALQAQNYDQEKRIRLLEDRDRGDSEWRRTHLPTIFLTFALVAVAVVTLITQLH